MQGEEGAPASVPFAACLGRHRTSIILTLLAFAVAMTGILATIGVAIGGDSPRYVDGADRLLRGQGLHGVQSAYAGYIAVVAFARLIGTGLTGVVVQIGAVLAAATALVWLGSRLGHVEVGVLGAAFFLLFPEIAAWHAYILTDSLYTSTVVLCVWATHRATELGGRAYAPAVALVLLGALLRPTGWVLPPAIAGYLAISLLRTRRGQAAGLLAVLIVCAGLALAVRPLRSGIESQSPARMLRRGQVIWGHDASRAHMPADGTVGDGRGAYVRYVLRHPTSVARLMATRVFTELAHIRPYYSRAHNAMIAAVLVPVYLLAGLAVLRGRRNPLVLLILGVIAAHLVVVALFFADWDGRFLIHVLPLVGLLAATSAESLTARHRVVPSGARRSNETGATPGW